MATANKKPTLNRKNYLEQDLRRSAMSCLLWEDEFYEDGVSITDRISALCELAPTSLIAEIAIDARNIAKLRHIPLFLVLQLLKKQNPSWTGETRRDVGILKRKTIAEIIQRPDELAELLALYWKDGKKPIPAQMKKGLALAFRKFDEYQLAKYNRDKEIKLRDVLFLCHAKPKNLAQEKLWKRLVSNELQTPDTWEVELSSSKDKKASWERLISESRLGGLAFLRNLQNMQKANVSQELIARGLTNANFSKVLPFRFLAAAKYAPFLEPVLEELMFRAIEDIPKLPGETFLLCDVSQSMDKKLSAKSDLTRLDAMLALATLLRETCNNIWIYSFSNSVIQIPLRRGFGLAEAINKSQLHSATYLGQTVAMIQNQTLGNRDRLIVITDEQSTDSVPKPVFKNSYVINVASNKKGLSYKDWIHIDGFSENVVRFISEREIHQYEG